MWRAAARSKTQQVRGEGGLSGAGGRTPVAWPQPPTVHRCCRARCACCARRALGLVPGQPGTYTVLGYTYHLMGDLDQAIENYHKVLRYRGTSWRCGYCIRALCYGTHWWSSLGGGSRGARPAARSAAPASTSSGCSTMALAEEGPGLRLTERSAHTPAPLPLHMRPAPAPLPTGAAGAGAAAGGCVHRGHAGAGDGGGQHALPRPAAHDRVTERGVEGGLAGKVAGAGGCRMRGVEPRRAAGERVAWSNRE